MKETNITDAEYEVMNIVWEKPGITSREVSDLLKKSMGWKAPTTKTLLGRLVSKKMLKTEKEGNRFLYSAAVEKENAVQHSAKEFTSKICSRSVGEAVAYILDNNDISSKDMEQIRMILNAKQPNDHIICNCIPKDE